MLGVDVKKQSPGEIVNDFISTSAALLIVGLATAVVLGVCVRVFRFVAGM